MSIPVDLGGGVSAAFSSEDGEKDQKEKKIRIYRCSRSEESECRVCGYGCG